MRLCDPAIKVVSHVRSPKFRVTFRSATINCRRQGAKPGGGSAYREWQRSLLGRAANLQCTLPHKSRGMAHSLVASVLIAFLASRCQRLQACDIFVRTPLTRYSGSSSTRGYRDLKTSQLYAVSICRRSPDIRLLSKPRDSHESTRQVRWQRIF